MTLRNGFHVVTLPATDDIFWPLAGRRVRELELQAKPLAHREQMVSYLKLLVLAET
jgi:hypothetical protein